MHTSLLMLMAIKAELEDVVVEVASLAGAGASCFTGNVTSHILSSRFGARTSGPYFVHSPRFMVQMFSLVPIGFRLMLVVCVFLELFEVATRRDET